MKNVLRFMLAAGYFAAVWIGTAAAETQLQSLDEGLGLFREAVSARSPVEAHRLYAEALLRLNLLVNKDHVRNGRIFHDIGDTYYRLGDIGRAILAYRRALLYRPRDPNLEHNLAFVRSQRKDRLPSGGSPKFLHVIFFWHYDLSLFTQVGVFLGFFGLLWVFLCAGLIFRGRFPRWPTWVATLVAVAFLGSLAWRQIDLSANRAGVIVASSIVARKGDALSYDPSFKHPLHAGTEFTLLSRRPEWYRIMLSNGATTWIPQVSARFVRPVSVG